MQGYVTKKMTEVFVLTLLLVLGGGAFLFHSTHRLISAAHWVDRSHRVLSELEDIPLRIGNLETTYHGYILTGDDSLLGPYKEVVSSLQKDVAGVERLVNKDSEQQQRFATLRTLLAEREQQVQSIIDVRHSEGFEAALARVTSDQGSEVRTKIRDVIDAMETAEWNRLTAQSDAMESHATRTKGMIIGGTLLALFAVIAAYVEARKKLRLYQIVEDALHASEKRYRTLVESAGDGIVTLDITGKITGVNRTFEHLTGWSRADLVGQASDKVLTAEVVDETLERRRHAMAVECFPSTYETTLQCKDGDVIPAEVRATFVRDEDGYITGIQELYHDVSIKRVMEEQRAELLRMFAHDLKNPVGIILGYIEILQHAAQERGAKEDEELLTRMKNNASALHSLVTSQLDLLLREGGQSVLHKEPLNLNQVVEKVVARYDEAARRKQLTLVAAGTHPPALVRADAIALERVLANLVDNAVKFTGEGGHISLSTERRDQEVVVRIRDTGPGLTPDVVEAFASGQAIVRPQDNRVRTALGLSIVKTLVEAHGGHARVQSAPGIGTCFSLCFPALDEVRAASLHEVPSRGAHEYGSEFLAVH
ncbi:MAG: CHASE3 domain-containing protein [Candidatus Binatia bacterium]